ncbi:MAG: CaiB/BaiF CoA-transferase family protein [Luminiphilus sp.]|jgi:alpha-methylacyl-CoA racemase|nr:CaiB/BaiF CoA-transferase family protein [Luminiphilus sp.]
MGSLHGYTIIELAGIGPAPMGAMILADMGAEVIRIERPGAADPKSAEPISGRNKKSVVLDLKQEAGREALLALVEKADAFIDPYRPGVCEKLGFGPDICLARNPRLVFARMTGWGQSGPLAQAAGHDLNYIAITGALHAIGRKGERPVVPLNLVGDFGGGGMLLVTGVMGGLLEAAQSGKGQVVDVAMVDGTAQLMWMMQGFQQIGAWNAEERESNLLDGAAHFYDTYECSDGKYVAVGAIEPQFYAELLARADVTDPQFVAQHESSQWPELKDKLGQVLKTRTRDEWDALMAGSDACFAPVLTMVEATQYAANTDRSVYQVVEGLTHPSPAPRFERTPSEIRHGTRALGSDTAAVLRDAGISDTDIEAMLCSGAAIAGS